VKWSALSFVSGNARAARQEWSSLKGKLVGHVFVPAALVLWVVVALVRSFATPDPAPASAPAVEQKIHSGSVRADP
jgi:hypothetical protein